MAHETSQESLRAPDIGRAQWERNVSKELYMLLKYQQAGLKTGSLGFNFLQSTISQHVGDFQILWEVRRPH